MAGNVIRCAAKYLYDSGAVQKDEMTVETASGVKHLKLYITNGKVSSVEVDMGQPAWTPSPCPAPSTSRN